MKEKDRKICFIVPTLRKGGLERVVSILSNNLLKHSKVSIITLVDNSVEYLFDNSIRIVHLNKNEIFNKYLLLIQLIPALKKNDPTIVVGFSEVFNPTIIVAAKYCNIKAFVSDRSNPLKRTSFRDCFLKKVTYWLANGIIAQTDLAKQALSEKKLNKNISILPNPVSKFANVDLNFKTRTIVSVGRLIKSKNHIELIKIFHEINDWSWNLIIVGEGPTRKELMSYIETNNLNGNVSLLGQVENIETALSQASIFAYTSLSEGFPNAVLEGMCFPLATIAYNCPAGVSDIITDNENGYLIPLNDRNLFKSKLTKLMNSEKERFRLMNESIKLREKYSQDKITQLFISFIND